MRQNRSFPRPPTKSHPTTMSTAIEQAIAYLMQTQQPVTVHNTFPVYMQYAGLSSCPDVDFVAALVAFERALDKHPAPPLPITQLKQTQPPTTKVSLSWKRLYYTEVEQLRKDYWSQTFGISDGSQMCTCAACGRIVRLPESDEDRSGPGPALLTKKKQRKSVNKREWFSLFNSSFRMLITF